MTLHSLFRTTLFASVLCLFLGASLASAQAIRSRDDSRGEVDLKADVRRAIDRDTDVANTALVFNNPGNQAASVVCLGYGPNGNMLGRRVAQIPARGLRYLRASDLSGGVDFIGSAICSSRVRLAGSAVFLAPGSITNLDVIQAGPFDSNSIRFPLVATY
jgi:hypothetical protein